MAQPITTPQHQLLALAAIHTPRKWHWFGMWPKYEKANTVLLVPIGPLYDHHKATHAWYLWYNLHIENQIPRQETCHNVPITVLSRLLKMDFKFRSLLSALKNFYPQKPKLAIGNINTIAGSLNFSDLLSLGNHPLPMRLSNWALSEQIRKNTATYPKQSNVVCCCFHSTLLLPLQYNQQLAAEAILSTNAWNYHANSIKALKWK